MVLVKYEGIIKQITRIVEQMTKREIEIRKGSNQKRGKCGKIIIRY